MTDKFEIGDKVKVYRKMTKKEKFKHYLWTIKLDENVGKIGIVVKGQGCCLEGSPYIRIEINPTNVYNYIEDTIELLEDTAIP